MVFQDELNGNRYTLDGADIGKSNSKKKTWECW